MCPASFFAPTATSSLLFGPRQIQISGKITFYAAQNGRFLAGERALLFLSTFAAR